MNRTTITYPCSCKVKDEDNSSHLVRKGFCEHPSSNVTQSGNDPDYWPVYKEVCRGLWGQGLGSGTPEGSGALATWAPAPSILPFFTWSSYF